MNKKLAFIAFGVALLVLIFGLIIFNMNKSDSLELNQDTNNQVGDIHDTNVNNAETEVVNQSSNETNLDNDANDRMNINQNNQVNNNNQVDNSEVQFISLEELSLHNSEHDCWVGYEGVVYDITSYVPRHPGGKNKIIPVCGTASEFEKAFEGQHGTSKVKTLKKVGILQGELNN